MTSGTSTRISPVSREVDATGQPHNLVANTRYSHFDPSISTYLPSPDLSSDTSSDRPSPWSGSPVHDSNLEDFKASVSSQPQVWTPVPSPYFSAPLGDPQSLLDNYVPGPDIRSMSTVVPNTDSSHLMPSPGCSNETNSEAGFGLDLTSFDLQHVYGWTSDCGSPQSVSRPASSAGGGSVGDCALTHNEGLRASSHNSMIFQEVTLEDRSDRPGTITSDSSMWKNTVGSSAILEASRRRRTKEASYFCEWPGCIAGFTARHNLESRLCSVFIQPQIHQYFVDHIKSHQGIREFVCTACRNRFGTRHVLTRHMKKCGSPKKKGPARAKRYGT
jgi:hypothetical protein